MLSPRDAVPDDIGREVRSRRIARGWSQERLARRVGVHRRTVIRLEAGRHRPSAEFVSDLEEALGGGRLVPSWRDGAGKGSPSYGPRARQARRHAGLTIAEVATAAGVGSATLSRFERELGDATAIMGPFGDDAGIRNEAYALKLGFRDAVDMDRYCMAGDPSAWLARISAVSRPPTPAPTIGRSVRR